MTVISNVGVEDMLEDMAAMVFPALMKHPVGSRGIYGVPRGGIPIAMYLAAYYKDNHAKLVNHPGEAAIIVDDLVDSGITRDRYTTQYPGRPFFTLIDKNVAGDMMSGWITFPWEKDETGTDKSADDIVTRLLEHIGEDPKREGLIETPRRFLKGWEEWASGYHTHIPSLFKTFEDGAKGVDEMVIVHNIPIWSKCEHHLADMTGVAHVGYVPDGKIIGLSKIARLVDAYGRRLQVQERLTNQIAEAMDTHLQPLGVAVQLSCSHACMSSRGVKAHGVTATTSALRGVFLSKKSARTEFLDLCARAR